MNNSDVAPDVAQSGTSSSSLVILNINFDEQFIMKFDSMVYKGHKSNYDIWISVRDDYLEKTKRNKSAYLEYREEYKKLVELQMNDIYIYSDKDLLGELTKKIAEIISDQKTALQNFLSYISHINGVTFLENITSKTGSRRTGRSVASRRRS
jgi:hypothetical protein